MAEPAADAGDAPIATATRAPPATVASDDRPTDEPRDPASDAESAGGGEDCYPSTLTATRVS